MDTFGYFVSAFCKPFTVSYIEVTLINSLSNIKASVHASYWVVIQQIQNLPALNHVP